MKTRFHSPNAFRGIHADEAPGIRLSVIKETEKSSVYIGIPVTQDEALVLANRLLELVILERKKP